MLESKADPRMKLELVLGLNPYSNHVAYLLFLVKKLTEKEDQIIWRDLYLESICWIIL